MTILAAVGLLLVGAFVKGILGLGLPMVAIPGLTLLVGLPQALAMCAIPVAVANAWQIWQFRGARSARGLLPRFVVAGGIGTAVGTWMLASVPSALLEVALAVMLVVYLVLRLANPGLRLGHLVARRLAPGVGLASGLLHGATGISGPIAVTFFHALRLPREDFILATGTMFLGFTVVQLPALAAAGILGSQAVVVGLLGLPAVAAGLMLGNIAARKVDTRLFDRLVLIVLAWTAATLIWRAVTEAGLV
ncbi:sulfite exporter TauE/SafE family protein [Roseitranquillus sediminis]|uniref:sulfite exporter TauE/SafE family protein n=1 Tax=Roseitranquillus sediminis TaxID=2809051 RepID=UPI001D0C71D8|nr:sulfite exporter TauE/SafE family protein [Roseitranquillus sediminis]MBM9593168.1 sulfite exporter TauE/SafE family protein [Roseitranquillus sediminis]